jgi:hypothetical protein
MRKIEEQIINAINARRIGIVKLSKRDYVETDKDVVNVILWSTTIAKIYTDKVVVNSGNWRTVTTKSRLNAILREYCNSAISCNKGHWIINGESFYDGMSIPRV